MNKSLNKFLSIIAASQDLPLSIIPEIILFICSNKKVLRLITCDSLIKNQIEKFAIESNLHFLYDKIYVEERGNTWATIHSEKTSKTLSINYLVTIGKLKNETYMAHECEIEGNTTEIGRLLGYPSCCVKAYDIISNFFEKWPLYYLNTDGPGLHSNLANRLTIAWGGISPIGELYPCSLECQNAKKLGQNFFRVTKKLGLLKLHQELLFFSKNNVEISQEGAVSLVSKNVINDDNRIIIFQ